GSEGRLIGSIDYACVPTRASSLFVVPSERRLTTVLLKTRNHCDARFPSKASADRVAERSQVPARAARNHTGGASSPYQGKRNAAA
ncbi:MAG: hypothetical protein ACXWC3_29775, partial [Burkholderiales bacterium]